MMFRWEPDMIRFMREASEYGSYYSELMKEIRPYLKADDHVCDAGCGLGYLSLMLADQVKEVTAVDINENALQVLRENCSRHRVRNINIICSDVFRYRPEKKYSAMIFCYFGDVETIAVQASNLCTGPIIIVTRNYPMHRFSTGSYLNEDCGFEASCSRLTALGIPFKTETLETEFGQPFRNLDDAKRFFQLYSRSKMEDQGSESFLESRLVVTGREDYPYYLPSAKKVGCIILHPSGQAEG